MTRLTKCCVGVHGIAEDNDVATVNGAVGENGLPGSGGTKAGLVDQEVVADQQGVFHGARRNAEGLHNKGDDEERDDQCDQGELQVRQHVPWGAPGFGAAAWA